MKMIQNSGVNMSKDQWEQHKFVRHSGVVIGTNLRDSCILTIDNIVYRVLNILRETDNEFLYAKMYETQANFYNTELESSALGVYKCTTLSKDNFLIPLKKFKSKCFKMPLFI